MVKVTGIVLKLKLTFFTCSFPLRFNKYICNSDIIGFFTSILTEMNEYFWWLLELLDFEAINACVCVLCFFVCVSYTILVALLSNKFRREWDDHLVANYKSKYYKLSLLDQRILSVCELPYFKSGARTHTLITTIWLVIKMLFKECSFKINGGGEERGEGKNGFLHMGFFFTNKVN